MIEVPQEIKDLFHLDSCPKNIRIHFPNGERTDICNDKIVKDTVSLKESLCSQNKLKFGLCESPVFECETVGVGNVTGATIEVFCEIYCDASVEGAIFQPDLQHYVYQVPYGVFVIQDATRQADMVHRRITAYNKLSTYTFELNDFEKRRALYPNSSQSAYIQNMAALLTENTQSNLFGCEVTELTLEDITSQRTEQSGSLMVFYNHYYKAYKVTSALSNKLYRIWVDDPEYKTTSKNTYRTPLFGLYRLYSEDNPPYVSPYTKYPFNPFITSFGGIHPHYWDDGSTQLEYIYPYMSMSSSSDNNAFFNAQDGLYLIVLYKTEIWNSQTYEPYVVIDYCDPDDIHIQELTPSFPFDYEWARVINENSKYVVDNVDGINLRAILEGFLETRGEFCGIDRFGEFFTLNIKRQFGLNPESNLYPDSTLHPQSVIGGRLLPQDYQSCWYDDDYIKLYGKIEVGYRNTNNVDCVYEQYFNGFSESSNMSDYQVYSLAGNQFIEGQAWTEQEIASMVSDIVTNLTGVSYMPVDFVGRGLPYVEAGDTFEILTKSHDSITTIVLDRTITGEMTLTDSYKSV